MIARIEVARIVIARITVARIVISGIQRGQEITAREKRRVFCRLARRQEYCSSLGGSISNVLESQAPGHVMALIRDTFGDIISLQLRYTQFNHLIEHIQQPILQTPLRVFC
jgi:hypothetical protein